jgi:DNA-binding LacI/PurR family transcriptional regulator
MQTVQVFDTWVTTPDSTLHFDVMTADQSTAFRLANAYLAAQGHTTISVTAVPVLPCRTVGPVQ